MVCNAWTHSSCRSPISVSLLLKRKPAAERWVRLKQCCVVNGGLTAHACLCHREQDKWWCLLLLLQFMYAYLTCISAMAIWSFWLLHIVVMGKVRKRERELKGIPAQIVGQLKSWSFGLSWARMQKQHNKVASVTIQLCRKTTKQQTEHGHEAAKRPELQVFLMLEKKPRPQLM